MLGPLTGPLHQLFFALRLPLLLKHRLSFLLLVEHMGPLLVSLLCRQNPITLLLVHVILKLQIYRRRVQETTRHKRLLGRGGVSLIYERILLEEICVRIVGPTLREHISCLLDRWSLIVIIAGSGCSQKHIKCVALIEFFSDYRFIIYLLIWLFFLHNDALFLLHFLCGICGTRGNAESMQPFIVISQPGICIVRL